MPQNGCSLNKLKPAKRLMDEETWFNEQESVANGFADRVVNTTDKGAGADNAAHAWNLAAYKNAPKPKPAPPPDAALLAHRQGMERRLALLEKTAA